MAFRMNIKLKQAFKEEMTAFYHARQHNDIIGAWNHLERAHILGQYYLWPHFYVHFKMFNLAWHQKDIFEMLGQLLRLSVIIPGALFRKIPKGNTGRAIVPLLAVMPIPKDLQKKLDE